MTVDDLATQIMALDWKARKDWTVDEQANRYGELQEMITAYESARSAEPVASEIGEEDIARAMEQRRRELIEQPLARIWPDLARVALALVQPALERARVALEPFDDVLGEDEPHLPDSEPVTVKYGPCTDYSLTLGDFRRARAAIRKG